MELHSYSAQIWLTISSLLVDQACVFNECLLHYTGPFYEDYAPADEFTSFTLCCIGGTEPGANWTQTYGERLLKCGTRAILLLDFSASQSNLVAYAAITSMNFASTRSMLMQTSTATGFVRSTGGGDERL